MGVLADQIGVGEDRQLEVGVEVLFDHLVKDTWRIVQETPKITS